jgi:carbon-monoxide dehydrogenase large subunit
VGGKLRHAKPRLCRIRPGALGGAQARSPGEVQASRAESLISDYQGRDLLIEVELALDAAGVSLALRASNVSNVGARCVSLSSALEGLGSHQPARTAFPRRRCAAVRFHEHRANQSVPQLGPSGDHFRARAPCRYCGARARHRPRGAATAQPGAGPRPCLTATPSAWSTTAALTPRISTSRCALPTGTAFPRGVRRRLREDDASASASRPTSNRRSARPTERAQVTVLPEGRVRAVIGTQASGQGHETSFAQVVCELLCVPGERVDIVYGDTDIVSARRRLALRALDASRRDRVLDRRAGARREGRAHRLVPLRKARHVPRRLLSRGPSRSLDFLALAAAARARAPAEGAAGRARRDRRPRDARPRYPERLRGLRVRGGPADGRGRAHALRGGRRRRPLRQSAHRARPDARRHRAGRGAGARRAVRDGRFRQPLAGTLMDYALPRAADLPSFRCESSRCSRPPTRSASRPAAKAAHAGAGRGGERDRSTRWQNLGVRDVPIPRRRKASGG